MAAGSVALATFAQSWHWVEPVAGRAELRRILGPGGTVGMVWNFMNARIDWVAELAAIWHTLPSSESTDADRHAPHLGDGFAPVQTTTVEWAHTTPVADLAALVTTRSYHLAAAPAEQQQIRDRVSAFLTDQFGDQPTVALPYQTHGYRVSRLT